MEQFIYSSAVFPESTTMESSMRIPMKETNVVASAIAIKMINEKDLLSPLPHVSYFVFQTLS